ncbi:MAG: TolC family protein [Puniceicoccales bacterium]
MSRLFIHRRRSGLGLRPVLALFLLIPFLAAFGEPTPEPDLTRLQGYLSQALAENPQLQAFAYRYEAAMRRIPQATALPDPMFQVTHFVESVQTRTGPQENAFILSQKLPWFGKLDGRKQATSAEAEALWYAYQSQHLTLARRVSLAFYEYAYLEKAIHLTLENRNLLQDLEPIVEERVRGGSELNTLLRLKVEIARTSDQLQSLEKDRETQSIQLRELLALPGSSPLPWPSWEPPTTISLDEAALGLKIRENNPELKMMERKIDSAEARQEIARLESYPDITHGLNYIQTGNPSVNPTTPDAGQDPWGFTVAVNIPVWFGKYNAAKAEALADKRSAESAYSQRLNELQAELSASLSRLEDANRRLALYGDSLLGLAGQAAENSRASYENGRTGILEVIDSERSLLDLQLVYWRAAKDAWQQRVILQTLTNASLSPEGTYLQSHE